MKVHGNNYMQKIMAAYKQARRSSAESPRENSDAGKEKVEISQTSRVLYEKMQELKNPEDISARAREIKELYSQNRYSVSSDKLAERMIEIMKEESGDK